jgi:hypothetical protein
MLLAPRAKAPVSPSLRSFAAEDSRYCWIHLSFNNRYRQSNRRVTIWSLQNPFLNCQRADVAKFPKGKQNCQFDHNLNMYPVFRILKFGI